MAEDIARQAQQFSAIPEGSCQYSSNLLAKGDLSGVLARVRPMVGNIGILPGSSNALITQCRRLRQFFGQRSP